MGVQAWSTVWLWTVTIKSFCAVGSRSLYPLPSTQLFQGQSTSVMSTTAKVRRPGPTPPSCTFFRDQKEASWLFFLCH